MHILRTSLGYCYIPVDAPPGIDPTLYPCDIAIIDDDGTEPEEADWYEAIWLDGEAALLLGPGSAADFPDGEYMAFVRVSAGIERPVLPSGRVRIGLAAGG